MIAEILSTGDEIRTGAIADTNAAFIAERLENAGLFVARHNCVGDDLNSLVAILKEIGGRCDIAVITGGLGPTEDDITALAAASASNVKLAFDEEAANQIKKMLSNFNRELNASNAKQAMLPENSIRIDNFAGTAPGFSLKIGKALCFFLPGVPFEMKKMFPEVITHIKNYIGSNAEFRKTINIKTFGMPESLVNENLKDFPDKFKTIKLGFRAVFPEIHIKLYGSGKSIETVEYELKEAEEFVVKHFAKHVFSTDGSSMEEVIGKLLLKRGATVATAESCTGGLIANRLTNVAGSSEYFLCSGVTYSNDSKVKILGVSPETIKEHGAVSVQTVEEMAKGAKKVSGANYAIAVSGIAGPNGGSEEKPVGTLCVGLAAPDKVISKKYIFPFKDRLMNKELFAITAMERLRRVLI